MDKRVFLLIFGILIANRLDSQVLQIFGGKNHEIYLGCLNCDKFNSSSIWNAYGTFGSKFNANSIWNAYGTYGSKFNTYSPWNTVSNDPPILADKDGNFYGYLTMNKGNSKRADFKLVNTLYEYHEFIMDDVSKWYDKIFE